MSKRNFLILIIILLILGATALAYLFWNQGRGNTPGQSGFNIGGFFPFGKAPEGTSGLNGGNTGEGGQGGENNIPSSDAPAPTVREVSDVPVAGATLIEMGSSTVIRYIESGTGHMYDTSTASLARKKISNTTIPKIYEALWGEGGESVVIRYLKDDLETIETFRARITNLSQENEGDQDLEGIFLPTNIRTLSVSPLQTRLFAVTASGNRGVGTILDLEGKKVSSFTLPLKEWLSQWYASGSIALTTKPSASVAGHLYTLNTSSGGLSKVMGDINGLTTLTRGDGEKVLYGESAGKKIALSVFNTKTGVSQKLSASTLPEKCVWSKLNENIVYCGVPAEIVSGDYPDAWYQGAISFTDKLWKIDTETGEMTLVLDFVKENKAIDLTNPLLSEKEDFILLTNKKDSTLWSVRIGN